MDRIALYESMGWICLSSAGGYLIRHVRETPLVQFYANHRTADELLEEYWKELDRHDPEWGTAVAYVWLIALSVKSPGYPFMKLHNETQEYLAKQGRSFPSPILFNEVCQCLGKKAFGQ